MIKGKKKEEFITYEEVLTRTNGGYDIYMYFEGKVPKRMKCPWRKDEHQSFGFFSVQGIWFWKDLAKEETGTAVEYVMKKYGLNFKDALEKIKYQFGWSTSQVNKDPVIVTWEKVVERPIHISFSHKPFTKRHHEFWNIAGVSEKDCNNKECWAIKDLAINRKIFRLNKDEIGFAYYAKEEDKVKIYLPDRPKDQRFYNNVSYFYLWNLSNVQKCDDLIVQKSMKDLIVTSIITPCVIATQAEAFKIFNEEVVNRISNITKNVHIFYGNDEDGVQKCKRITKEFGWKYINIPRDEDLSVNDAYEYSKKYGIAKLEEFMKRKKII